MLEEITGQWGENLKLSGSFSETQRKKEGVLIDALDLPIACSCLLVSLAGHWGRAVMIILVTLPLPSCICLLCSMLKLLL